MIGRLLEQRVLSDIGGGWVQFDQGPLSMPDESTAGQQVTSQTAQRLLTVSSSVGFIANQIATLPVDILDSNGVPMEQLPPLAREPQQGFSRTEVITMCVTSLLLNGNLYVAPMRDDANRTQSIVVLDPNQMDIQGSTGGRYRVTMGGKPVSEEIRVVRGLLLPGSVKGLDPITYARQLIGIGLGAQEQAARFYSQGSITPGVIEVVGNPTAEQMRETRDQWVRTHGGARNSHIPVVLANGQFKQISMSWEQAQFLETRKYTDAQIAGQLFHLDPSFLAIPIEGTSLTYQTLETRNIDLLRRTLLPWITRLEELFTGLLPAKQAWKFNIDGVLRADLNTRYASYKTAAEIQQLTGQPLLTVDEMRELEDRSPLGGIDDSPSD